MKSSRGLLLLLGFLYLGFIGFVVGSYDQLPERVATHFDGHGQPNGWMSRTGCVAFSLILGFVFPLTAVVASGVAGRLPDQRLNLPHRDYWLSPERRDATHAGLRRHALGFAGIGLGFVAGIHALILHANRPGATRLSLTWMLVVIGGFLAAVAIWGFTLIRHFTKVSQ